jgi:hypothetical protein
MDTPRRYRIQPGEFFQKSSRPLLGQFLFQGFPQGRVGRGGLGEAVDKVFQVKARSPGNNRQGPPAGNLSAGGIGQADKIAGVKLFVGIYYVDQVVGEFFLL